MSPIRERRDAEPSAADAPETLALQALAFVIGDEVLRPRFLALSGIAPDELAPRLQEPALLGAVLDFLLAHEPDLIAFAASLELAPQEIARARHRLPGAMPPYG